MCLMWNHQLQDKMTIYEGADFITNYASSELNEINDLFDRKCMKSEEKFAKMTDMRRNSFKMLLTVRNLQNENFLTNNDQQVMYFVIGELKKHIDKIDHIKTTFESDQSLKQNDVIYYNATIAKQVNSEEPDNPFKIAKLEDDLTTKNFTDKEESSQQKDEKDDRTDENSCESVQILQHSNQSILVNPDVDIPLPKSGPSSYVPPNSSTVSLSSSESSPEPSSYVTRPKTFDVASTVSLPSSASSNVTLDLVSLESVIEVNNTITEFLENPYHADHFENQMQEENVIEKLKSETLENEMDEEINVDKEHDEYNDKDLMEDADHKDIEELLNDEVLCVNDIPVCVDEITTEQNDENENPPEINQYYGDDQVDAFQVCVARAPTTQDVNSVFATREQIRTEQIDEHKKVHEINNEYGDDALDTVAVSLLEDVESQCKKVSEIKTESSDENIIDWSPNESTPLPIIFKNEEEDLSIRNDNLLMLKTKLKRSKEKPKQSKSHKKMTNTDEAKALLKLMIKPKTKSNKKPNQNPNKKSKNQRNEMVTMYKEVNEDVKIVNENVDKNSLDVKKRYINIEEDVKIQARKPAWPSNAIEYIKNYDKDIIQSGEPLNVPIIATKEPVFEEHFKEFLRENNELVNVPDGVKEDVKMNQENKNENKTAVDKEADKNEDLPIDIENINNEQDEVEDSGKKTEGNEEDLNQAVTTNKENGNCSNESVVLNVSDRACFDEKPQCDLCNLIVNTRKQLEIHIRLKHTEVINYNCEKCEFQSNTKSKLEEHYHNIHTLKQIEEMSDHEEFPIIQANQSTVPYNVDIPFISATEPALEEHVKTLNFENQPPLQVTIKSNDHHMENNEKNESKYDNSKNIESIKRKSVVDYDNQVDKKKRKIITSNNPNFRKPTIHKIKQEATYTVWIRENDIFNFDFGFLKRLSRRYKTRYDVSLGQRWITAKMTTLIQFMNELQDVNPSDMIFDIEFHFLKETLSIFEQKVIKKTFDVPMRKIEEATPWQRHEKFLISGTIKKIQNIVKFSYC